MLERGRVGRLWRLVLLATIAALGVGLSVLAYWQARDNEEERLRNVFEVRAGFRAEQFRRRLTDAIVPIEAVADFIGTQQQVDLGEFTGMADRARGDDPIARIAWAPLVRAAQRAPFEALAGRLNGRPPIPIQDAASDAGLATAPPRDEYLATLTEARFDASPSLLGLDWLALPGIDPNVARSRDSGEPYIAVLDRAPIGSDAKRQLVLFWPVYHSARIPDGVPGKRAAFAGVAIGVFPLGDLFAFAAQTDADGSATLHLFIDPLLGVFADPPAAVWRPGSPRSDADNQMLGDVEPGGLRVLRSFSEFGREWSLVLDYPPSAVGALRSTAPWRYLALGLVLTAALTGITWREQRRRQIVEAVVVDRTRDLFRTTEQLTALIESSPVAIGAVDLDRRVLAWNAAAEETFGYTAKEIIGQPYPLTRPGGADTFDTVFRQIAKGEVLRGLEVVQRRKDGQLVDTVASAALYRNALGEPQGVVFALLDVSERKRKEAIERELTNRLRGIVETAPDAIILIDQRGLVQLFNPAASTLFGYAADEVIGRNVRMLMPPPFAEEHDGQLERYRRTKEKRIIGIGRDVTAMRKDGRTFPMHLAVGEIVQENGSAFIGIAHDLTERHAHEDAIRQVQALLAGIVESSEEAIISKDLDGIVTSWNKAAETIFGYRADEIIGRHISLISAPGREQEMIDILARVKAGERVRHHETQRRRKDGSIVDISLTVSPIRDGQGRVIGASKMANDITAIKARSEALRRSREHLALVQRVARIGSTEVDLRTQTAFWSEEIYRMLGIEPNDVEPSTDSFADAVHPDDREIVWEASRRGRLGETVEPLEFRVIARDGSIRWYYRQADFVRDKNGQPVSLIATMYDITARKAAEAAQRSSEEQYRLTFDLAPIGIAHVGLDGRYLLVNDRLCRMFGCKREELLSSDLRRFTLPDDIETMETNIRRLVAGEIETLSLERRYLRGDGSIIWCDVTAMLRFDPSGRPDYFISIYSDVTDRVNATRRRLDLEEQLRQSQKMEAVGQLTGGVAHDFNNLLTVVLGNLELIRERPNNDAKLTRQIDAALGAGRRGADLTQRLLAFSRRQPLEPVVLDLNEQVKGLVPMLKRAIGEAVEIKQTLSANAWKVVADPSQFDGAIMNLAVNSRDAMPTGGKLEIKTENIVVDDTYAAQRPELAPGYYVRVSVSDTGSGMPQEVVERAFDPFFTTKEVGKGTGLGLSMIYGFAKQSGGHASIYSEVGVGTTVTLLLPADPSQVLSPATEGPAVEAASGGGELVLVVEDDPDVRNIAVAFLDALGYRVLEAGTAQEGVEAFVAHPGVGLVLTDVILPGGGDGASLARRVREIAPGTKVLFMSGYTDDVVTHGGRLDHGVVLLRKPFTRAQLAEKIRIVLDDRAAAAPQR